MSNLRSIYVLLAFLVLLSGCSKNSVNETVAVKKETTTIEKSAFEKIKKKKIVKKKKKVVRKRPTSIRTCSKYIREMQHAANYVNNEFKKGYFEQNDIVGAKAQLFLVKNKSLSVFAKNINDAQNSYLKHYRLAKKNQCNIKKYKISPIDRIKNKIKLLEGK